MHALVVQGIQGTTHLINRTDPMRKAARSALIPVICQSTSGACMPMTSTSIPPFLVVQTITSAAERNVAGCCSALVSLMV